MIKYDILSEGNETGKYYSLQVNQEIETGLFSRNKVVTVNMKLILKNVTDRDKLQPIIQKVLKKRSEWLTGSTGKKYIFLSNGSKAIIESDNYDDVIK